MPITNCPYPGCTYATGDISEALAVTMLTIHASGAHCPAGATTTSTSYKTERVKRPTVTAAGTSEDWTYFKARWEEYTAATKVTGVEKVIQLLECCEEELRKDLTRTAGRSLANATEDEVLAAIKLLAVREENTMVARVELYNMQQDHEETIRSFGARIRGQANVCKYTIQCTAENCEQEISYTDQILRDVLIRGVADLDIRLDLLQDKNQDMTLEEVFQFIEAKEAGKRSASKLQSVQGVESIRSQYRRDKNNRGKNTVVNNPPNDKTPGTDKNIPCCYCGETGHGSRALSQIRMKSCSAYDTTCSYCKKAHHIEGCCRAKKRGLPSSADSIIEMEGATFDAFCSIVASVAKNHGKKSINLDHHLYNNLNDQWVKQNSKPQPFIQLSASIDPNDYSALGFTLTNLGPSKTISLAAMADTGCQSCLTSFAVIQQFGLSKNDLIPVSMQMHAANNKGINILGAVILRFSGKSATGDTLETRQITYVTDNSNKLFLSREACTDLGIISRNFPTIGEIIRTDTCLEDTSSADSQDTPVSPLTTACTCPKRHLPPPKPTKLPIPATEANREYLQKWLLDYYKSSTFNICEHQPLPMMEGPPLQLMVDKQAKPVAHHKPIPVPLHWQDDVKAGLDQDVRLGVIEPVPVGEPVTWCHQMIIASRKNGKPRRTVDFQALNTHATRETHHTQSPFHQARAIPHHTKKTVFDCWNGYHSIPLHEDDRHLTTFISPWGRYRYRTGPQGYIATGDGYTRRFDEIVEPFPKKTKCVDDTCMWTYAIKDSFFQAIDWLDICGRHGITLNPEKFVFACDTVEFAGFEITPDSVRPCMKYLNAIQEFPTPRNITDVRSWFGLLNQVSYTFSVADRMLPFRQLLKPSTPFHWTTELDDLFEESKRVIIQEIEEGVKIFDPTKLTCLATDWSKTGIGFWLFQKHCQCQSNKLQCCPTGWKITLVGSRFTHPNESTYAPVEGEALAVGYSLDKARYFVLGCKDLIIAVDHKPLLKIFSDRSLDIPNTRLRNLKEKTLRYKFTMQHIPGVKHKATDALSRHPSGTTSPAMLHLPDDVATLESCPEQTSKHHFLSGIRCTELLLLPQVEADLLSSASACIASLQSITWNTVKEASNSDKDMVQLLSIIESGFTASRAELPPPLREYYQFRDDLYCIDGVIMYKERIVIPPALRQDILGILHSAHQGTTSMIARAESTVFWPGITPSIASKREKCNECNRMAPSQPSAPPFPVTQPTYPFQCICADFFQYHGKHYLIIVDRYSNWPIVERAADGVKGLINNLRRTFVTYGIPDEIATDGGPEFTASATTTFLKEWRVHHRLSSVAFPHSNSRAEIGVKTVKRLITSNIGVHGELDTDAFQVAMLQYRNTPDPETKLSPAMCVFGRPIKDFIPILPGRYQPHPTWSDTLALREEALRNRHMKAAERWSEHTRRLPPLQVGDSVRIQNQTGPHPNKWDKTGTVVEVRQFDQYVIRVDGSGRVTLRNRKFLRKYSPVKAPAPRLSIREDLRYIPQPMFRSTPPPTTKEFPQAESPPCAPSTPNTEGIRTPERTLAHPPRTEVIVEPPAPANSPSPVAPPHLSGRSLVVNREMGNDQSDMQNERIHPALPSTPVAQQRNTRKVPLALRRLANYNRDGLKE